MLLWGCCGYGGELFGEGEGAADADGRACHYRRERIKMGRAGSGGHHSSHRSGGHHVSRPSSSHRPSSSRRSSGSSVRHSNSYSRSYSHRRVYSRGYSGSYSYQDGSGSGGTIGRMGRLAWSIGFAIVFIFLIEAVFIFGQIFESSGGAGTVKRTRIKDCPPYVDDCILDELGWFDNERAAEAELKNFWEKTGVQPIVYLRSYDAALINDGQKEDWAVNYFETEGFNENTFLFVYFAEEDADNDVGYMCYVSGYSADAVMDDEAVDIFWDNIDNYWYTDLSTDDMFEKVFDNTANEIMGGLTVISSNVAFVLGIAILLIIVSVIIYMCRKKPAAAAVTDSAAASQAAYNAGTGGGMGSSANNTGNTYNAGSAYSTGSVSGTEGNAPQNDISGFTDKY